MAVCFVKKYNFTENLTGLYSHYFLKVIEVSLIRAVKLFEKQYQFLYGNTKD